MKPSVGEYWIAIGAEEGKDYDTDREYIFLVVAETIERRKRYLLCSKVDPKTRRHLGVDDGFSQAFWFRASTGASTDEGFGFLLIERDEKHKRTP